MEKVENLNLLKNYDGEAVEINREFKDEYIQEFSEEISIIETNTEVIMDNLQILTEDEEIQDTEPIKIKKEEILDIDTNFSGDLEIYINGGNLITIAIA